MKLLVVSPHIDDETLGAGGTLLKYKEEGHKIYWLNFTNVSEEYGYSNESVLQKRSQIKRVLQEYQINKFYDLELRPAGLDEYSKTEIFSKISNIINDIQPDILLLPNQYDIHSDHAIVFQYMFSCSKVFRYPSIKKILCMEILSETDFAYSDHGFSPNYFIDITNYIDKKIAIMELYETEIAESPFPRSEQNIRSLASYRGATAGFLYAEAFRLIKCIEH